MFSRDGNQAVKSVCMVSPCSRGASQNIPLYDLQSKHVKYYNLKYSVISLSLFIIHIFYSISPWSTETVIQKRFCFPISESAISSRNTILHCISSTDFVSKIWERWQFMQTLSGVCVCVVESTLSSGPIVCVFLPGSCRECDHTVESLPFHYTHIYCMGECMG